MVKRGADKMDLLSLFLPGLCSVFVAAFFFFFLSYLGSRNSEFSGRVNNAGTGPERQIFFAK